jgi:thiol-disulfide isomerase/thioredoxin
MRTFEDDQEFEAMFQNWRTSASKSKTIIYFGAKWCGPCKQAKPLIAEYENKIKVPFYHVDVNEYPNTAGFNGVRKLPCIIMYEYATPVKNIVGFKKEEWVDFFQSQINESTSK